MIIDLTVADATNISWAAFQASVVEVNDDLPTDISSLLPLFQEQAKSPAMIKHAMNVIKQNVGYLNPSQIPVIAFDQPLHALAKTMQWNWPETYGEDNFVIMFGGFHIEMAALKTIGDWLADSGWVAAITEASNASPGTADSFLKASHVSRTRHAHQVTAAALFILMHKAYSSYLDNLAEDEIPQTFYNWRNMRIYESPQFQFWSITIDFEITILMFVQSLREGNFQLYIDALTELLPWFFTLDHHHYSRWLPVHLRDMQLLANQHPTIKAEFDKGNFVVNKTKKVFAAIPIDQAHEQNNKCVKGDGGAVGLTENSKELLRWIGMWSRGGKGSYRI